MWIALAACAPVADAPALTEVVPGWGWTGEATPVSIAGENLFPDVTVAAGGSGEGEVDGGFLATLSREEAEVRVDGVQHVDYRTLTGVVPAGLAPGTWDLRVETPGGGIAELEGAFVVTSTRADHLDLTVSDAAWEVGELAEIGLSLRDPGGAQVAQALTVEVRAESIANASGVRFEGIGLVDATELDDGVGVRGRLADDGTARLVVTSDVPDDVTFTVTAVPDEEEENVIREDSLLLSFDPGALAEIRVELPAAPFTTVAGEPWTLHLTLLDALGNVLSTTASRVLLTEECGEWQDRLDIVGTASITVETTAACPVNRIEVFNESFDVLSEPFEVSAAAMSQYTVQATPATVVAGEDPVLALVSATDTYGNIVADHAGEVILSDSEGGIDLSRSRCPAFSGGLALCTVFLQKSGDEVLISASDGLGRTGASNAVNVVPGPAASVEVIPRASEVEAGGSVTVEVTVRDAYGNAVDIEPGGADPVTLSDEAGELECAWNGPDGEAQTFACVFTTANADVRVTASVLSLGVTGTAVDGIAVTNGALAKVDVVTSTPPLTAGEAFAVTLRGYDAWDNPYVDQLDPVVDLADSTGTLSPASATLGADGSVIISASITGSGLAVVLSVAQAGVALGETAPFVVEAGAATHLEVEVDPWIALDEAGTVSVVARDAWGNVDLAWDQDLVVESGLGLCDPMTIDAVDEGSAASDLACGTAGLAETVTVTASDGLTGTSEVFDVVDLGCAAGPVAELEVDGEASAVLCLASGTASATADASGSIGGIVLYHFGDGAGGDTRTLASSETLEWASPGIREVTALAVDGDACADVVSAWVYVGKNDGEPTGPVTVEVLDSTVLVGGSTSVSVSATDCTGDVAGGQALLVRADLGEPAGTATGEGLSVTLDAAGEASFDWSFPSNYAGDATVYAGSSTGGAFGSGGLTVEQDAARPRVVEVEPSGVATGSVEEIVVIFDETMLGSAITGVTLTGPSGAVATTQALDDRTLTITPSGTVDADAGSWTLTLATTFRDLAGNRLDGAWDGTASAFSTSFGNVADTLPVVGGCPPSVTRVTPDGDDAASIEADTVTFNLSATSAPSWWWLTVTDEAGTQVRSDRTGGAEVSLTWDARGDDGFVVASGVHTASIRAIDAQGNVGSACSVEILVAQRVESP